MKLSTPAFLPATAALLLAATAPAQFSYAPTRYATLEASGVGNLPFGSGGAVRTQYLYHGQIAPTRAASQIGFRGNSGVVHPGVTALDLEILAGGSTVSPEAMSAVFTDNHGPDFGVVFTRKLVDLPPLDGATTPQPWIELVLDTPILRTSPHLLVEFAVHAPNATAANYDIDAATIDPAQHVFTGTDCNIGPALVSASISSAQSRLDFFLVGRAGFANGAGALLIGSQALPSPLPLLGCQLYQDVLLTIPAGLDAGGGTQLQVPMPIWSKGLSLQTQWLAVDPTFATFGATFSTGTTIGGADAVASNFSRAFGQPAGQVRFGAGAVLRFR